MLLKTQIRKEPDKGIYSRDTGTVRTSLHCVDIFVCIFVQERNWEEREKSKREQFQTHAKGSFLNCNGPKHKFQQYPGVASGWSHYINLLHKPQRNENTF